MDRRLSPIDVVAVWLLLFGVWPLFDPGHDMSTIGGAVDVLVHWTGAGVLAARWTLTRRQLGRTNHPTNKEHTP
jgi:hypothetical protein